MSDEFVNESFDKISEELGTTFSADDIDGMKEELAIIDSKKTDLIEKIDDESLTDEGFLRTELKTLIIGARIVLQKVQSDIKIGTPAKTVEAYAKLLAEVRDTYKELRELSLSVHDAKKDLGKIDINNVGNKKIPLTANQLLELVEKAKENSEMNKIDANFEIEEGGY